MSVQPGVSPVHQLTLSLTAVRDSTVSSRLGRGTADWGTMSLSSRPSPAASGSTRILVLPSAPVPPPGGPGGPGGPEPGGLELLLGPLSPPRADWPRPSGLASLFGMRPPRLDRGVLRSWGCSVWFCWAGRRPVLDWLEDGRWDDRWWSCGLGSS